MVYTMKEMKDGQEEIIYTKQYDELEREFFELYLEEQGIECEDEYEEEGGDIDDLWDDFFETDLYKKDFFDIINKKV